MSVRGAVARCVECGKGSLPVGVMGDVNRPGFVGGSNFQIGWSRYEQDDEQILS